MNDRSRVLANIKAIADYALIRSDVAAMEGNKYAVATWNHVASNLLDIYDEAEAWDTDTVDLLSRLMNREL